MRGHGRELLAGERAGHRATACPGGQVAAPVAAEHAERQVRRAGCVRRRHAGMRVLLELERRRPAVLDRVAEPVQRADAGIAAPGEDELPRAAHPDQLVVDDVGRHPDQRQVAPFLPDQLVPRGVRNQVREALERDGVAVVDELGDRIGELDDRGHSATGRYGADCPLVNTPSRVLEHQDAAGRTGDHGETACALAVARARARDPLLVHARAGRCSGSASSPARSA